MKKREWENAERESDERVRGEPNTSGGTCASGRCLGFVGLGPFVRLRKSGMERWTKGTSDETCDVLATTEHHFLLR